MCEHRVPFFVYPRYMDLAEIQKSKGQFLLDEVLLLTVLGGFGRSSVYKKGVNEEQKLLFRKFLKRELVILEEKYHLKISDTEHLKNIRKFKNSVTNEFSYMLEEDKFRYGIAQKLINLFLKYRWSLDLISEPPHCPFDSVIAKKLGSSYKFTKSDSEKEYLTIVNMAEIESKKSGHSISIWEMETFNGRLSADLV